MHIKGLFYNRFIHFTSSLCCIGSSLETKILFAHVEVVGRVDVDNFGSSILTISSCCSWSFAILLQTCITSSLSAFWFSLHLRILLIIILVCCAYRLQDNFLIIKSKCIGVQHPVMKHHSHWAMNNPVMCVTFIYRNNITPYRFSIRTDRNRNQAMFASRKRSIIYPCPFVRDWDEALPVTWNDLL